MQRALLTAMVMGALAFSGEAVAQQKVVPIVGTYLLIQDDDGSAPRSDAQVTLVFLPDGSAVLSASLPGTPGITDKGGWSVSNDGKLTLVLPESGKAFTLAKFTMNGRDLTLPFRVFSDTEGSSSWKRSSTLSLRAFAKDKEAVVTPTVIAPTGPAKKPQPDPVVINIDPKPVDPKPADPKPGEPVIVPPVVNTPPANPPTAAVPAYVGRYQGTAIGAEVRYRKDKVFTLTAKHIANFSFNIDEKNEVKGIGEISYVLDSDRKGTGMDADEVENFPITYSPGGALALHESSLQGGTVTKTFELKGTFDPKTNALTLILVTTMGDLIYEYADTAGKKAQKPFPAWSPFPPDVPATLEIDDKGGATASVDLTGIGRRDKWQEYRFVWKATKL
jgi:hypothetical protein